jgi:hypothetical protein
MDGFEWMEFLAHLGCLRAIAQRQPGSAHKFERLLIERRDAQTLYEASRRRAHKGDHELKLADFIKSVASLESLLARNVQARPTRPSAARPVPAPRPPPRSAESIPSMRAAPQRAEYAQLNKVRKSKKGHKHVRPRPCPRRAAPAAPRRPRRADRAAARGRGGTGQRQQSPRRPS